MSGLGADQKRVLVFGIALPVELNPTAKWFLAQRSTLVTYLEKAQRDTWDDGC